MSKVYNAIWLHLVWSTKKRAKFLDKAWRSLLFEQMQKKAFWEGFPIDSINGIEDHLHILLQLPTTQTVSKIVKALKVDSYFWLGEQIFCPADFGWQDGYFVSSVSGKFIETVRAYIANQEIYHQAKSLKVEMCLLKNAKK